MHRRPGKEEPLVTTFALFFMLVSMLSVTFLMVYCFWRVLRGGDVSYDTPGEEGAAGG